MVTARAAAKMQAELSNRVVTRTDAKGNQRRTSTPIGGASGDSKEALSFWSSEAKLPSVGLFCCWHWHFTARFNYTNHFDDDS